MASHYHHCHHPIPTPPPAPAACYCTYSYTPYPPCHHPPPDPHLHHHPHPQPHPHLPNSHPYHSRFEETQPHPTISSLLRRISALESALRRRSSSSNSLRDAAARTIQIQFRAFLLRRSRTLRQLKCLASIKSNFTILKSSVSEGTHFDYDVVYRKAVALLLRLDAIQGGDPMIRDGKSSISRDLNRFLVFIDGFCVERRGVSRVVSVKYGRSNVKSRASISERKTDNLKCGGLKRVNEEKLRGLAERIEKLSEELDEEEDEEIESPTIRGHGVSENRSGGLVKQNGEVQPKVKKSVSFAENGKVYRVVRRNGEPFLVEDYDESNIREKLVDVRALKDDLCRAVEEIGISSKEDEDDDEEEAHSEEEGSLPSSDGEKDSTNYVRSESNFGRMNHNEYENEDFTFSAPLPPKMEARAGSIEKRKKIAE